MLGNRTAPVALLPAALLLLLLVRYAQAEDPDSRVETRIVAGLDGRPTPLEGLSFLSVPASSDDLTLGVFPKAGKRVRFRLDPVDTHWREGPGEMLIGVRFFDVNGDLLNQQSFAASGESPGWTGDLKNPLFVHRREIVTAPDRTKLFWFIISSAGPPPTLGTLLVEGVSVSRLSSDGSGHEVLRAPVGRDERIAGYVAPAGFWSDGTRPRMASLLSLASRPSASPIECFAIIDSDTKAHAEWHTSTEGAIPVSPGEQLVVEWNESFSIGFGDESYGHYRHPPSGSYRFRVQEVDLVGQPTGVESSLLVKVLAPWWQAAWIWISGFVAMTAVIVGITRSLTNRQIRRQLTHLRENWLVEQERLRIARDIHDTLAQGFTGVIMQLEAAEEARNHGHSATADEHAQRASAMARDSLQEARRSVRALRPQILEESPLHEALDSLFKKLVAGTSLRAAFIVEGIPRALLPESEENLLRLAQEVLTNVFRHAEANHFKARMTYGPDGVCLEMRDDGCGFDTTVQYEGFGLRGMGERVQAMGGEMMIQSASGKGSLITISVPE